MQRCKKCGHEVDYSTGTCRFCGLRQWGVTDTPEKDTETTGLEMWARRTGHSLRRTFNNVAAFEHKSLVAALVLLVVAIIVLTVLKSVMCG